MIWLLRDLDLVSVLLHALTLSLEALVVGGVFFHLFVSGRHANGTVRLLSGAAFALAVVGLLDLVVTGASVTSGSGSSLRDLMSASFLQAECVTVIVSLAIGLMARRRMPAHLMIWPALILTGSMVGVSHAVSQMQHRLVLTLLTVVHHLSTAAWIGGMPYLLVALGSGSEEDAVVVLRRFSRMALISVGTLVAAGIGLAYFYVGSIGGFYGTSYGLMLAAKIFLLMLMLLLGGLNWLAVRRSATQPQNWLRQLGRFSAVEIGLGATVLLATASLTAQTPAVDVEGSGVTLHELAWRLAPRWPRLSSPPLHALAVPVPIGEAIVAQQFQGVSPSDANDMAWSEYNHHWAGIMVLLAGALALASRWRGMRWARYWPLAFLGLAAFIVLRADPEAWPLGPRPFWATFSSPDVLEHRVYALLIVSFALFECAVQTGRLRGAWGRRSELVFPGVCALGGAVLLTHSHGLGDAKQELLIGMSHTWIALLGVTAGWARWMELRLDDGRARRIAAAVWPLALMLVAAVLLDFREA